MNTWDGVAKAYRRSFATLCAGAIPTLLEATAPGSTHLDVGCGTGELALAAVEAITANFVINHVPDPRASLRDLARVAAPSARVAMTIWPSTPGPHLRAYGEASRAAGAAPVESARLAPELDFPRSVAGLADITQEAGLVLERAVELHWSWRIAADDLMAGIAGGVAGPGRIHRAQSAGVREEIEQRVRELWSEHTAADGSDDLAFPVTAVLVVAVRP